VKKMWEGRFAETTDADFDQWQRSFPFDWRLLRHELAISRAHASTLEKAGVLTVVESAAIAKALDAIDAQYGHIIRPQDEAAEDVHHFVERRLVEAVGDLGLKLHTALLAYVEMALRDVSRLQDCAKRMNLCPLGSGAVAGATLALDRDLAARLLHFDGPTANSMDATSDRDFVLEILQALTTLGLHITRFAEEITLFATTEFGFIELPEPYSTGSSAMPQKKKPDLTEMLRGKIAHLHGAAAAITIQLKGLPLAYNKDMQEMQLPLFGAVEQVREMLSMLARFTAALRFRQERMRAACESGFLNAMAAATYLTRRGIPFRTAHGIVGHAVRLGLERGCELGDLPLEDLQALSPEFQQDFYGAITLRATLDCHDVIGGTAVHRVKQALAAAEERVLALVGESHACA